MFRRSAASLCALGAMYAEPAHGAAWPAPAEGQSIVTAVYGVRDEAAFSEADTYWQAPIAPRYDLTFAAHAEAAQRYGPEDENGVSAPTTDWAAEVSVAGKRVLYQGQTLALSAQVGALGVERSTDQCGPGGGEARLLGGVAKARWFVDGQGAYRLFQGGCGAARLDMTAGWKPTESWMGMAQTFVERDERYPAVVKLQLSVVRLTDTGKGVQLGVRVRADETGDDERALVVGWWKSLTKAYRPRID